MRRHALGTALRAALAFSSAAAAAAVSNSFKNENLFHFDNSLSVYRKICKTKSISNEKHKIPNANRNSVGVADDLIDLEGEQ